MFFDSLSITCFLDFLSISSNSTIVPLFEKILSASDAGRIGRLVLPKACAEVEYCICQVSLADWLQTYFLLCWNDLIR